VNDRPKRTRTERLVSIGVELATLALVWRALDGPDPRGLLEDVLAIARAKIDAQLNARRGMLADLETIRHLPETEGNP